MKKLTAMVDAKQEQGVFLFSRNATAIALSSAIRSLGGFIGVYLPLYFVQIGGNPLTLGFLTSVASVFQFLALCVGGFIADYHSRKKVIVLAVVYGAFLTASYALVQDWRVFGLLTVLAAVGAVANPAVHATIADSIRPKQRTTGIATIQVISTLPAVISPAIGGWLIQQYGLENGFRIASIYAAVFTFVSAITALVLLKETLRSQGHGNQGLSLRQGIMKQIRQSRLMLSRSLKVLVFSYALVVFANGAVASYYVLFASNVVGLTAFDWGAIVSMQFLLTSVLKIPGGWLSDKFGKRRIMIASLMMTIPTILVFTLSQTLAQVVISALLLVAAGIYYAPAHEALQADLTPTSMRGRITALWDMSSAVATALGALAGGFAFQMLGLAVPFYIFALAEFGAAILLIGLVKEPAIKET